MTTQLRQCADGVKDILVANIAKDATGQNDVSGDRSLVGCEPRRVSLDDLDLAEANLRCLLTSGCDIPFVEFDQAGLYMVSVRIGCQCLTHVKPLARAQTDDLERAIKFRGECFSELSLNHR